MAMTELELKRIFSGHIDDWCRDQEGEKTFEDYVLSAMREAVQKESIEFAEWIEINFYRYIHSSKKWFKVLDALTFPIDTPTLTTEQLYQEYIIYLSENP